MLPSIIVRINKNKATSQPAADQLPAAGKLLRTKQEEDEQLLRRSAEAR
jgi:hypothetical protein